ncbi:MAG: hypothetical protein KAJ75_09410 [Alphaproteobacteria bacterium]|nr:hypothetical protein [Alphaproteobacteria bacterium]
MSDNELELSPEMLMVIVGILANLVVMFFARNCYFEWCSLGITIDAIKSTAAPFPPSVLLFLGYGYFSGKWFYNALFNINGHPILMDLQGNVLISAATGILFILPFAAHLAPIMIGLLIWDLFILIKESNI